VWVNGRGREGWNEWVRREEGEGFVKKWRTVLLLELDRSRTG